jgi:hypothetical protein
MDVRCKAVNESWASGIGHIINLSFAERIIYARLRSLKKRTGAALLDLKLKHNLSLT